MSEITAEQKATAIARAKAQGLLQGITEAIDKACVGQTDEATAVADAKRNLTEFLKGVKLMGFPTHIFVSPQTMVDYEEDIVKLGLIVMLGDGQGLEDGMGMEALISIDNIESVGVDEKGAVNLRLPFAINRPVKFSRIEVVSH